MQFWKAHALGNDYIILDGTGGDRPEPGRVQELCDRHRGVGGDGVLVADLDADPVGLRIFNPDGTEAEKSGNGLRIFGAWLHAQGHVGRRFEVSLGGSNVGLEVEEQRVDGTRVMRVDMGPPAFRAADVGYTAAGPNDEVLGHGLELDEETVEINLVSMGNPHCVVFVDDLDRERFRHLAPLVQAEPAFEAGVNVQFARRVSSGVIDALVWERGAGETLASGSSACAVVAAARRRGLVGDGEVEVRMPGGAVRVRADDAGRLQLSGDARLVFRGTLV